MSLASLIIASTAVIVPVMLWLVGRAIGTEKRVASLETKVGVFWRVIEEGAGKLLHRDDTPEIDALLEKATEGKLSKEDALELVGRLKEIEHDRTRSAGEIAAAVIMRAVIVAKYHGADE